MPSGDCELVVPVVVLVVCGVSLGGDCLKLRERNIFESDGFFLPRAGDAGALSLIFEPCCLLEWSGDNARRRSGDVPDMGERPEFDPVE